MKIDKLIAVLFYLSAAYDGILGLIFLLVPWYAFEIFQIPLPNHFGYVQFPAALLLVFAWIFVTIARDALANKNLIQYGIMLKISYCSVAGSYWLAGSLPLMWQPFVIIDAIMGVLYVWAYRNLCSETPAV